jgi:LysM repeat protein
MSDDLERTIRESLDRHARTIGSRPDGHLDAVWSRLDHRRDRRRRVAAVGSALAVGAGVTGLVMVGGPGDGPAPGEGAPITTLAGVAWRCTGLFGDDGTYRYYTGCTPVAELPPFTSTVSVPFTGPAPTAPPTTAIDGATPVSVDTTAPFIITNPPLASVVTFPPFTAPPTTAFEYEEYDVQAGDSLFAIAERYGVDPLEIAVANEWDDGADHTLIPGEVIVIPLDVGVALPITTAPMASLPASHDGTGRACEDATATVPCPTASPTTPVATDVFATTAPPLPVPANSFRCTGVLGSDGAFEYLATCDTIGPDGAVEPGPVVAAPTVVPTTAPGTVPMPSTVPPTTALAATIDADGRVLYTVQPGDNPAGVAAMYGITVQELIAANDPDVMNTFLVGATLIIPQGHATSAVEQVYVIQEGDNLARIAEMFGIDMQIIVTYNEWTDGVNHLLMVGDTVKIPPNATYVPPPTTARSVTTP